MPILALELLEFLRVFNVRDCPKVAPCFAAAFII